MRAARSPPAAALAHRGADASYLSNPRLFAQHLSHIPPHTILASIQPFEIPVIVRTDISATYSIMAPLKGPGEARTYDGKMSTPASSPRLCSRSILTSTIGSNLRIGILHARWNTKIIDALLAGAKKELAAAGVKSENIVIQDVPGSYELPFAVQRYVAGACAIQCFT